MHTALAAGRAETKKTDSVSSGKRRTKNLWPTLSLMAILILLPVLALPLAPLLLQMGSSKSTDIDSQRLCDSALLFKTALLEGDIPSAMLFVAQEDKPRLEQWSAPQRAALAASFGRSFEGRVTEVEVTQRHAESAVVRVRFKVQGREQQTFQNWERVHSGWVVRLNATVGDD